MTYLSLTNPAKVVDWARSFLTQLTQRDTAIDTAIAAVGATGFVVMEVAASSVATPATGRQALFLDTADHKLKRKDSSGAVTVIG